MNHYISLAENYKDISNSTQHMTAEEELSALQKQIEQELICPLKDAATHIVFGKGNPQARIVFIGEAPGREEDLQGKPFVGRAGQELDKLLRKIGLKLDDVYICNILKYRPPQNRDPTVEEINNHTPYLIAQLKIIKPEVVITLGNYSTKFVLAGFNSEGMNKVAGITKLHGSTQQVTLDDLTITVMPMYHPAAMLYNPSLRNIMDIDFLALAKRLGLDIKEQPDSGQLSLDKF